MAEKEDDFVNLPDIPSQPLPEIPALPLVTEHLSDAQVNKIHLQMSNLDLQMLYQMWPQVKTISGVTKMIDASIKAVKHQRDLLCLPYGHRGSAERKDVVFAPIDD